MVKKLIVFLFSALIFFQNACIFNPFGSSDIRVNSISSNKIGDYLEWSANIINDGNAFIHELHIMVDFYFNGGINGSGSQSILFTVSAINIEIGQTYRWEASIFENHSDLLHNNRDFDNLTTVNVRTLEAYENGVKVASETYSGNEAILFP